MHFSEIIKVLLRRKSTFFYTKFLFPKLKFRPKTSRKHTFPTNLTKQFPSQSRGNVGKLCPPLSKQQLLEPTNFRQRLSMCDVMLSSKFWLSLALATVVHRNMSIRSSSSSNSWGDSSDLGSNADLSEDENSEVNFIPYDEELEPIATQEEAAAYEAWQGYWRRAGTKVSKALCWRSRCQHLVGNITFMFLSFFVRRQFIV